MDSPTRTGMVHPPCQVRVDETALATNSNHNVIWADISLKNPLFIEILYCCEKG